MSWFSERLGRGINRWRGYAGRPPIENGATRAMMILGGLAGGAGLSALGGAGAAAAGAGTGAGVGGSGFGAGVFANGVPAALTGAASTGGASGIAALLKRYGPAILQGGGLQLIQSLIEGDPKLRTGSVPMSPEQRALYDWVLATLGPKPTQGQPTLSYLGPVIHQMLERFGNADFQMPLSVAIPGIPGSGGQRILGGAPFRPLDFTGIPKPWESAASSVPPGAASGVTGPMPTRPMAPFAPSSDAMRTGQSMTHSRALQDALQTWILKNGMGQGGPGGPRYY